MSKKVKLALGRKSHVHYSEVLTNVAVEFTPPELVARQILPVQFVENDTDVWPVFDKALFDQPDDTRADGDEANEATRGWKYDNYSVETHALKDIITAKMRRNWDSQVDLEASVLEALKQWVWNNYEVRVLGSGGLLRTAANNIYSANVSWATLATASPRTDVDAAIAAIEDACGLTPNTIVMTTKVARQIMATAEYRDESKYTVDIRGEGGSADLPSEFYGMKAVYARSLINTAKKGVARTLSRVMGDDVWIGYVDPAGIGYKRLTYGVTLMTFEEARKWFDEDRNADVVEYEANYQPKRVAKECGALLTSVLT